MCFSFHLCSNHKVGLGDRDLVDKAGDLAFHDVGVRIGGSTEELRPVKGDFHSASKNWGQGQVVILASIGGMPWMPRCPVGSIEPQEPQTLPITTLWFRSMCRWGRKLHYTSR